MRRSEGKKCRAKLYLISSYFVFVFFVAYIFKYLKIHVYILYVNKIARSWRIEQKKNFENWTRNEKVGASSNRNDYLAHPVSRHGVVFF